MKKYLSFCASLMALAALSACSDTFRPGEEGDGEGRLMLRATINSDVTVKTRAGQTNDELAKKTKIWISNAAGAVHKYNSIDEVPSGGIKLLSGHYIAEAWAGDSVSASWESRYFKGYEEFDITKGSATQVNIDCKIANTLVSVVYDEKIATLLKDVTMEVGHDKATGTRNGTLTFDSTTPAGAKAYFMTNSRSKDLLYTLRGTLVADGKPFEYTGKLENVARATEYRLTVKHTDKEEEAIGGAWITIVVDETEVEVEDSFEITAPPMISGISFDLNTPISGTVGEFPRRSLWVAAASDLREVTIQSPALALIADLGGDDAELLGMRDNVKDVLEAAGINYIITRHEDTGMAEMKINFEASYLNSLPEGDYTFTVTALDANDRTAVATFRVIPTNAKVMTDEIDPNSMSITSRSNVVTGRVLRDDATSYGIQYRKKGTQQWTKVAASTPSGAAARAAGDVFSVTLTGLEPSTTYETVAYCDGFEGTDIREFTTEGEPQLPNAGFEDWTTDGKVVLPTADKNDLFWDSGNHGSSKMNKNITNKDTELKHSGNSSAKLNSQFVGIGTIGKFAAGNIFIGKYLKTDGTDGVLGWGRGFNARPKALRVWVKYTPAAVTDVDKDNTDKVQKGDMDKGIVYIALTDGTKTDFEGSAWPMVIKTKSSVRTLFNKYESQVIAYGEHVFAEATPGDGLIEVVIPIDYRRTDVRPSNIVLVASASKMGDYFTGGNSVMYIDDVELIYGE